MEYLKRMRDTQQNIERLIILVYGAYTLHLMIAGIILKWENWLIGIIVACFTLAWGFFVSGFKTFRLRIFITSIGMQISFVLYAAKAQDLDLMITTFVIVILVIAFYGMPSLLWTTMISVLVIAFYHLVIAQTPQLMEPVGRRHFLTQIAILLFIQAGVAFWAVKREETSEQMVQMIDTLIDAEQSKDDFLANVSHEIRTPINTICGMGDMALIEPDPQKLRDEIYDIRTSGQNLMSLVNDIMDFSQLQSGKMELEEETYNISSTLHDIINLAIAKKKEKRLDLIVDCDASIPHSLLGDEKKIRRVIMNLLDNAIKFTNDGCVTILVEGRREDYGINISITVKDTGIGIDDENRRKIFQSFSQIDSKRNRQEGGIGLGLAISKALVQRMGGTLIAKSQMKKGTVMKVVIPQKIVEDIPIAIVKEREKCNIGVYINLERFQMSVMRDDYRQLISHMASQLKVRCHGCRNLAELKRRMEKDHFSHVFVSLSEYQEEPAYFEELADKTHVVLIIDQKDEAAVSGTKLQLLYKPFFVIPVVSILNGSRESVGGAQLIHHGRFKAPSARVLIVDDNMMNIRVAQKLLDQYEIQSVSAVSGMDALEKIESMDYDFVFMDHMMPEMDGIETLHRLRAKRGHYYQNVPVIVLTANAIPGNREIFLAEGFADFVAKPIEISVLERVLKRTISPEKLIFEPEYDEMGSEPEETVTKNNTAAISEFAAQNSVVAEDEISAPARDRLIIGELDVDKGLLYCGGEKSYMEILQSNCEDAVENYRLLEKLYERENWKDYTIKIHALKSSMMSIGAVGVSEQAKELEHAGKNGETDMIRAGHDEVMKGYQRVIDEIMNSRHVYPEGCPFSIDWDNLEMFEKEGMGQEDAAPDSINSELETGSRKAGEGGAEENRGQESAKDTEKASDGPSPDMQEAGGEKEKPPMEEISEEKFDELQELLENAMYEMNGDEMLNVLGQIEQYTYHGEMLKKKLSSVRKKIDMMDLMSAGDKLAEIRKHLKEGR